MKVRQVRLTSKIKKKRFNNNLNLIYKRKTIEFKIKSRNMIFKDMKPNTTRTDSGKTKVHPVQQKCASECTMAHM